VGGDCWWLVAAGGLAGWWAGGLVGWRAGGLAGLSVLVLVSVSVVSGPRCVRLTLGAPTTPTDGWEKSADLKTGLCNGKHASNKREVYCAYSVARVAA
jgi:hypothetical protein